MENELVSIEDPNNDTHDTAADLLAIDRISNVNVTGNPEEVPNQPTNLDADPMEAEEATQTRRSGRLKRSRLQVWAADCIVKCM